MPYFPEACKTTILTHTYLPLFIHIIFRQMLSTNSVHHVEPHSKPHVESNAEPHIESNVEPHVESNVESHSEPHFLRPSL